MERWTGILRVPVCSTATAHCRMAASLCVSPNSDELTVPLANAIFFNGDRVEGTGNPVIERLSDIQRIAQILVSKFGASVNTWVIEAPTFNGPFAIYKDFIPSVNKWGEPESYKPHGFPASSSIINLLTNFLQKRAETPSSKLPAASPSLPHTYILGFSKGGTVMNQLVTELAYSEVSYKMQGRQIIPSSPEAFLKSIREIHYIDVGLNSAGAYLTDEDVIRRLRNHVMQQEDGGLRFVVHGTPRQWCDARRGWICKEKDELVRLLESEAEESGGKLQVCERFYFADERPSLQMHFEIIEKFDVS